MVNRKPQARKRGVSRSTLVLVGLWVVTGSLVSVAHWTRPPAAVRLEITAGTIAFTLAGQAPQLLLGTTVVDSLTIAGFRSLEPVAPEGDAGGPTAVVPPDAGASVSIRPAELEAVSAGGRALVRINRTGDEPYTRITVSRATGGTVRLPSQAEVRCYRCGNAATTDWLVRAAPGHRAASSLTWKGRDEGGGTDLLLQSRGPLVLSDDDLRVEGALDTREAAGGQFVSTVREASLRFLETGGEAKLGSGVRLEVGGISPGTGLLKRLEVGPQGVSTVLEARVDTLSVEQAGRTTTLLPSYLEIGFHSQRWLYLAQGLVLVGGTLTKVLRALTGGKDA